MEVLAIIPARGGSTGIPQKNLACVEGVPLIGRTVQAAIQSKRITRVVTSTDDDEIARAASKYGSEVCWRPTEISHSAASSESALLHTLSDLQEKEGYSPALLAFLQCTTPFLEAEDIDGAIDKLVECQADCVLTVSPFNRFLWKQSDDGTLTAVNHSQELRIRRQDRPPDYIETGGAYILRTDGFLKAEHRFFGKIVGYSVPPERNWEIDTPLDLEWVRFLCDRR